MHAALARPERNIPLKLLTPGAQMRVVYTNWRGETRERHIEFSGVVHWAKSEWHPEPQWMIWGDDLETGEHRCWAIADMKPLAE
jgi:hypothetical protein